jgi:hypothetical protein
MIITSNPTKDHINQIQQWLKEEESQKINFFHNAFASIKRAFDENKLICVVVKNIAIGFIVYEINNKTAKIIIANIKTEFKGNHYGKIAFNELETILKKKGILVIELECSTENVKKIWKKLNFIELNKIINYSSFNKILYLYNIIVEEEKPIISKSDKGIYIELYCKDPIKKDDIPDYVWNINPETINQKPIIYPVDPDWNINFYKNEQLIISSRIKQFCNGKFLQKNFMIIDKIPNI